MARTALVAGNNAEALGYFNRVLEADPSNSEAWIGKGKAAGWQSSLRNIRLPEMMIAFKHAIATAPEQQRAFTTEAAVQETNRLSTALYKVARKHLLEYISLAKSWSSYIVTVATLIDALDEVSKWVPSDRSTLENIVYLCKDNIEGITFNDRFDNNIQKAWTLTPQYEARLQAKLDSAAERLRVLDPSYTAPTIEKQKPGPCFVVTATMGDFDHPTVTLMRSFRDEWILTRRWGPAFVAGYYQRGPALAALIREKPLLRAASYWLVVAPVAWFVRRLQSPRD
jgi:tetratricopeptide (TPR) repeat protein